MRATTSHLHSSSVEPEISRFPEGINLWVNKATFHHLFWDIWLCQVGWRTVICRLSSRDAPIQIHVVWVEVKQYTTGTLSENN